MTQLLLRSRISIRALIYIGAALIGAAIGYAFATADASAPREITPLSCDGKPADFHADRGKALGRDAFDFAGSDSRILDASPDARKDRRAIRAHRLCLRDVDRRHRITRYIDRRETMFEERFLILTYPPGLAVLSARRDCEASGDYYANTGNGFQNGYQFTASTWSATEDVFRSQTGLEPNPSRLALPREQDIRASIAQTQSSGDPWPNCP